MSPTDESLLQAFNRGDTNALGALAQRYERPLLGLALGLLDRREDLARDAIQETWLRVIRFGKTFNGTSSVKTWLYRIAINRCHELRSRGVSPMPDSAAIPPPNISADETQSLLSHIASLKPDRRVLLLLCYHDGLTHEQAADVLELPLGTLKSRLHATLTELRRRMSVQVQP